MKSRASKVGSKVTKTAKTMTTKVAKTGKTVGHKMAETGKHMGDVIGHGASTAKTKTVAAFGALKQKVKGRDEEE